MINSVEKMEQLVLLTCTVHGIIFTAAPACGKTTLFKYLKRIKDTDIVDLDDYGQWVYDKIFNTTFVYQYNEIAKDKTRFYVGMDGVLNYSGLDISQLNEVSKDFFVYIAAIQTRDISFVYHILTIEHIMSRRQRRFLVLHYKVSSTDKRNYEIIEAGMHKRFDPNTSQPYPGYAMYDSEIKMIERSKELYHSLPYQVIFHDEIEEFIERTLKSDEFLQTMNPKYRGSF
jgi:hypothetical protein